MKTLFIFLLCACALLPFSIKAFAEERESEGVSSVAATVTADRVNVRAGKGLNFEILCQLNKRNAITITGENTSWYKIELPKNASCFVHKDYVLNETVEANSLRVRSGAGLNYTVLGMLKKGQKVKVLKLEGNWIRIAPPENCYGWIAKQYAQLPKRVTISIPKEKEAKEIINAVKMEEESTKHKVAKIADELITKLKQKKTSAETSLEKAEKPNNQKQIQSQKENVVEEKASVSNEMIEFVGVIKEVGRIFNRPSPYKIALDEGGIYYLKSEDINLHHYVHRQVSIVGEEEKVNNFPHPVLRVEQIKAAKQ